MLITTPGAATPPATGTPPVIIDLGEHTHKRVKLLRHGRGKLLAEVNEAVRQLQADGKISGSAQPVIVIVRDEGMGFFGM